MRPTQVRLAYFWVLFLAVLPVPVAAQDRLATAKDGKSAKKGSLAQAKAADGRLLPAKQLKPGQGLSSPNRRYRLYLQRDGNLVLFNAATREALWSSKTENKRVAHLIMRDDGNLVLYSSDQIRLWSSGTEGKPGAYLAVQNDGNVVVYHGDKGLWSTNTHQPRSSPPPTTTRPPEPPLKGISLAVFLLLPRLNQGILVYASSKDNQQVGSGDCWEFVNAAMSAAGAVRGKDPKVLGIEVNSSLALPGDLLHFDKFKSGGFSATSHFAILWKKNHDGAVEVLHANAPPNGKRVGKATILLKDAEGTVRFYRPTPIDPDTAKDEFNKRAAEAIRAMQSNRPNQPTRPPPPPPPHRPPAKKKPEHKK
jgi:hypothetical protein